MAIGEMPRCRAASVTFSRVMLRQLRWGRVNVMPSERATSAQPRQIGLSTWQSWFVVMERSTSSCGCWVLLYSSIINWPHRAVTRYRKVSLCDDLHYTNDLGVLACIDRSVRFAPNLALRCLDSHER